MKVARLLYSGGSTHNVLVYYTRNPIDACKVVKIGILRRIVEGRWDRRS